MCMKEGRERERERGGGGEEDGVLEINSMDDGLYAYMLRAAEP